MSWFEEQIKTRRTYDENELADAYARVAASVVGKSGIPRFTLDDAAAADSAVDAVMAYYGMKAADVPDSVTDAMDRIDYAIRPSGIMRRQVRLEGKWWKDATGAYLATLEGGVPVAVLPDRFRGYIYVDPRMHRKIRINKTTCSNLSAEALCFYRPLPQHSLTLADLGSFMFHALEGKDYILMILATFVATSIGLLPAIVNKLLFSRIIPSGMPSLIAPIGALMVGMTVSQSLVTITSSVICSRLATKLQTQMEAATYARVLLLPPSFFNKYAPGDLSSRVSTMHQIVMVMSQMVFETGLTSVFSLMYVWQIFTFAPQLALPALVVVLAEVAASMLVTVMTARYNREQMKESSRHSGVTPAILHGVQKIKLAGAERRAFAHWMRSYAKESDRTYSRPALLLAGPALVPLIGMVGTMTIYFLAATTEVSVADYMAFNTAFGSVSGALTAMIGITNIVATVRPMLEMVEPIMKAVPETLSTQRQVTSVRGAISVSNVSFRYGEGMPLVLDKLSLNIRPGEYVAIVGRTGCGKSTLMRLLLGFEKPTRGSIYYDREDIANVDIRSLRSNVGVVMQNGTLFQGPLYMNITVSSPKATLEDAWEAAELAGIADDIRKMPMGMQTLISEGSGGISGGQRQRILIARAVCGKPKILMLDEATSALDNITQKHVSDALTGLKCTRIVIAHRLSTIRYADRVVMLEDGGIVEDGTYDELVAANGKFAELVRRQQLDGE